MCSRRITYHLENHLDSQLLVPSDAGLGLSLAGEAPIVIDFEAVVQSRCKQGVKKPGILKACKPSANLKILDATAGLGRDAAVLASSGAEVSMCERAPLLIALLKDALKRLNPQSGLNLNLIPEDAIDYLKKLDARDYPDVIYLDPMHPVRNKSARVKKDLYALQQLLGADDNPEALLHIALLRAKLRVVMKWPLKQPALLKPNHTIQGKTVRFDVYAV